MNPLAYIPGTEAWRMRRNVELCRRTAERIQQIVDGEIASDRAARVLSKHVDACRSCHEEAEVIRDLKEAIARVGGRAEPELVQRLQELARELCEGRAERGQE